MISENQFPYAMLGELQLQALKERYELGDKTALYEAIDAIGRYGAPQQSWVVTELRKLVVERWRGKYNTWKGPASPKGGNFKKWMGNYLRSEVQKSVKQFLADKRLYKHMPTACIQAWYDGKLDAIDQETDKVVTVANIAMAKTCFGTASFDTYAQHNSFKPHNDAEHSVHQLIRAEMEKSEAHGFAASPSNDEAEAFFRDIVRLPFSFGYRDSEIALGLRQPGQFWGPPETEPPEHIKQLLADLIQS